MIDRNKIEKIVCDCVNEVLSATGYAGGVARPDCLYSGSTKTVLAVCAARQFAYYVMHDMYHDSYSVISRRCGFSVRNVVRGVCRVRELVYRDDMYKQILEHVNTKLRCV